MFTVLSLAELSARYFKFADDTAFVYNQWLLLCCNKVAINLNKTVYIQQYATRVAIEKILRMFSKSNKT